MKGLAAVCAGMALSTGAAWAGALPDPQASGAAAKAPAVLEHYASALGCSFSMPVKTLVPFTVVEPATLEERPLYLALFQVDEGCVGDASAVRTHIAALQPARNGGLYVVPGYSQTSPYLPQRIDRLFVEGEALRYTGQASLDPANPEPQAGQLSQEAGRWIDANLEPLGD
ncbi:hypothetical protein QS468_25690 [Bacillus subtilis]|nr:hypothetical protein [Pseudomonas sp. A29(2023)]MDL5596134.1 hypothetical protein [Bacillus subtilis]